MEVYLASKICEDGDGIEQEEALGIFYDKKVAEAFCLDLFVKTERERLFNEDGTKKLIEISEGIWDGVRRVRYTNYPDIYYRDLEKAENHPEEFKKLLPFAIQKFEVK